MFVFSLKAADIKKLLAVILAAALIVTGAYFLFFRESKSEKTAKNGVSTRAETAEERIAFISSFGYQVSEDPIKVEEVIIPAEFDESYTKYNEIQKQQNFDLEKYRNCRVKKWTYEVINYPGSEGTDEVIEINLLVCDSMIIGADIQSLAQDGFIKALGDKS